MSYGQVVLALLGLRSLRLAPLLGARWARNSIWARLGAARVLAQTISYEVMAAFVLVGIFLSLNVSFLGRASLGAG